MNWHTEIWSEDGEKGVSINRTENHLEFYLLSSTTTEPDFPEGWEKMHEDMDEFHYRYYLGSLRAEEIQTFLRRTFGIVSDEIAVQEKEEKGDEGAEKFFEQMGSLFQIRG